MKSPFPHIDGLQLKPAARMYPGDHRVLPPPARSLTATLAGTRLLDAD